MLEVIDGTAALVLQKRSEAKRSRRLVQHDSDENDHAEALVLTEALQVERCAQSGSIGQRMDRQTNCCDQGAFLLLFLLLLSAC